MCAVLAVNCHIFAAAPFPFCPSALSSLSLSSSSSSVSLAESPADRPDPDDPRLGTVSRSESGSMAPVVVAADASLRSSESEPTHCCCLGCVYLRGRGGVLWVGCGLGVVFVCVCVCVCVCVEFKAQARHGSAIWRMFAGRIAGMLALVTSLNLHYTQSGHTHTHTVRGHTTQRGHIKRTHTHGKNKIDGGGNDLVRQESTILVSNPL